MARVLLIGTHSVIEWNPNRGIFYREHRKDGVPTEYCIFCDGVVLESSEDWQKLNVSRRYTWASALAEAIASPLPVVVLRGTPGQPIEMSGGEGTESEVTAQ